MTHLICTFFESRLFSCLYICYSSEIVEAPVTPSKKFTKTTPPSPGMLEFNLLPAVLHMHYYSHLLFDFGLILQKEQTGCGDFYWCLFYIYIVSSSFALLLFMFLMPLSFLGQYPKGVQSRLSSLSFLIGHLFYFQKGYCENCQRVGKQ